MLIRVSSHPMPAWTVRRVNGVGQHEVVGLGSLDDPEVNPNLGCKVDSNHGFDEAGELHLLLPGPSRCFLYLSRSVRGR